MADSHKEKLALLRLYFAPRVGAFHQRRLLQIFGSAEAVFSALEQGLLERHPSISPLIVKGLKEPENLKKAEREMAWLRKNRGEVFSFQDPGYPFLLKQISDPPPILFYRGSFSDWENSLPLAFVGTRGATDYGRRVVESLMEALRGSKVVIVSGFARGIDSFAHQAALKVSLPTLGVLGTGLDTVYPAENKDLFEAVLQQGGFLTEYAIDSAPHSGHFPERNRIISGLARAVLVIEAPAKSGALITADFALEQGREVFAVPGSIFSLKNQGCHRLIQQGAKLVARLEDILEELKLPGREKPAGRDTIKKDINLDGLEKNLWEVLTEDPLHIDKISEISNLAPSSVAGSLMSLVLKGLVEELPGKYFVRS